MQPVCRYLARSWHSPIAACSRSARRGPPTGWQSTRRWIGLQKRQGRATEAARPRKETDREVARAPGTHPQVPRRLHERFALQNLFDRVGPLHVCALRAASACRIVRAAATGKALPNTGMPFIGEEGRRPATPPSAPCTADTQRLHLRLHSQWRESSKAELQHFLSEHFRVRSSGKGCPSREYLFLFSFLVRISLKGVRERARSLKEWPHGRRRLGCNAAGFQPGSRAYQESCAACRQLRARRKSSFRLRTQGPVQPWTSITWPSRSVKARLAKSSRGAGATRRKLWLSSS